MQNTQNTQNTQNNDLCGNDNIVTIDDWERMVQNSDDLQDFVPVDRLYKNGSYNSSNSEMNHLFEYDINFNRFLLDMKHILEKIKSQ